MKSFFLLLFLSLFINTVFSQRFDIQMQVDGKLRESIVVIPTTPPPPGGYPLVVMLHGSAQDGPQFYDISGWKELGEEKNFITVFPTALRWCYIDEGVEVYQTRWVNGNVIENPCSGPPQQYIDDVRFLKLLVAKIRDTIPVNASKIFASGFSNGSAMIHKLAMDAGDVFTAVAGSGAGLTRTDSVGTPVRRIPIWLTLGNMEPGFTPPNLEEIPFGGDSVLAIVDNVLHRSLDCQALSDAFIKTETEITHTYTFNDSMGVSTDHPYLFTLIKGMVHIYPNGVNFPLSAPRLFWEFFEHAYLVSTKPVHEYENWLETYPNPSDDIINLKFNETLGSEPVTIQVFNSFGQLIFEEKETFDNHMLLNKEHIGTGLFIVHASRGSRVANRKILFY